MLRRLLLPFALALAIATPLAVQPPPAFAQKTSAKAKAHPAVHPAPPVPAPCLQFYLDRSAPASATPPPADEHIFCHSFYVLSYSSSRRDPVWTSYLLTRAMVRDADGFGRHSRAFAPQQGLTTSEQPDTADFSHRGIDRGHMTPDNDARDLATQADTYWVTNIVPQNNSFNRGLWANLEGAVHRLAKSEGEVYIVTGPIFAESRPPLNGITVPSAIFKAIYVPSRHFALAFVATNAFPSHCRIVAIAEVQRQTGLDPFPSLTAATKASLPALPRGWGGFPRACRVVP